MSIIIGQKKRFIEHMMTFVRWNSEHVVTIRCHNNNNNNNKLSQ